MTEYRGYRIIPLKNLIGYQIQHIGRGSVHGSLAGSFTSVGAAKNLIDAYKGKEVDDGETDADSGDQQVQRRPYHRRKSTNDT